MNAPTTSRRVRFPGVGGLFVLLWSTGFIGAKLGLPYAEPLTFLSLRMALVTVLLAGTAFVTRAPWPGTRREVFHIVAAGLLVHGGYLSGVFSAIHHGLSAGIAALIVGLQPLLTAVSAAVFLDEKPTRLQWLGLALGLVGVVLVVFNALADAAMTLAGLSLAIFALVSITAGTLYQKRFGARTDFRSGGAIQYAATGLVLFPIAALTEDLRVVWSGEFVFALAWLVLVLSVGAVSLLYLLIRRGKATEVASLFYLTPPTTAIMAFLLFGETLQKTALVGMVVAVVGVALVLRK